jgi:hypothetical protein
VAAFSCDIQLKRFYRLPFCFTNHIAGRYWNSNIGSSLEMPAKIAPRRRRPVLTVKNRTLCQTSAPFRWCDGEHRWIGMRRPPSSKPPTSDRFIGVWRRGGRTPWEPHNIKRSGPPRSLPRRLRIRLGRSGRPLAEHAHKEEGHVCAGPHMGSEAVEPAELTAASGRARA